MEKELIFLTDITLHTRGYRQTANFSKVAQKGRMYSPMPLPQPQVAKKVADDGHSFHFSFALPEDLKEKVERGEAVLMVPEDGLPVYAGPDVQEKIQQMRQKERRGLIHSIRSWFPGKRGV